MTVLYLESWQNMYGELPNKHYVHDEGVNQLSTTITGPFGEKYTLYTSRSASASLLTTAKLQYKSNYVGAGCWFYSTNQGNNAPFFALGSLYDANFPGVYQIGAHIADSQFQMRFRSGAASYTTAIRRPGMETNRWYYFEFEFFRNSSGWVKAWIDGQYVGQYFGDTEYQWWCTLTHAMFRSNDEYNAAYHGPYWVLDLTAQPHNTMPLGIKRVENLVTSGAGNYTQWDVSGESNNYDAINDETVNTNRVETSVSGEYDTYVFEDIEPTREVLACQLNLLATKSGVGERSIKTVFRSEGGEALEMSGEHFLNQSYNWYRKIYDNNPSGEISWTATDLISGEWGMKLQT